MSERKLGAKACDLIIEAAFPHYETCRPDGRACIDSATRTRLNIILPDYNNWIVSGAPVDQKMIDRIAELAQESGSANLLELLEHLKRHCVSEKLFAEQFKKISGSLLMQQLPALLGNADVLKYISSMQQRGQGIEGLVFVALSRACELAANPPEEHRPRHANPN